MTLQERETPCFSGRILACPLRGHWTSFRLVDEQGDGKPYGGLPYTVVDSVGQEYTGRLNGEGVAKVENHYRGPVVLKLDAPYQGVEATYRDLMIRKSYPFPSPNSSSAPNKPASSTTTDFVANTTRPSRRLTSSSRSKCGTWSVKARICHRWSNASTNHKAHCFGA